MKRNKIEQFKKLIESDVITERFDAILGEGNGAAFLTQTFNVFQRDFRLHDCNQKSILMAAANVASLGLLLEPSLNMAYIKPLFEKKSHGTVKMAQFQIGYKGLLELGHRSGQYLRLNLDTVREGEFISIDRMTGDVEFDWIQNNDVRNTKKIVGYMSYFKLLNGFEKTLFMTNDEMTAHAKKYSDNYGSKDSSWSDDKAANVGFENMAKKTVLKLNLDRWSPKSTQLKRALITDQAIIHDWNAELLTYDDNPGYQPKETAEQLQKRRDRESIIDHINNSQDPDLLSTCYEHIPDDDVRELYDQKMKELTVKK